MEGRELDQKWPGEVLGDLELDWLGGPQVPEWSEQFVGRKKMGLVLDTGSLRCFGASGWSCPVSS